MLRASTISEELECIGCLSTNERRKRTIVQLYYDYSTIPLLSTHSTSYNFVYLS